MGGLAKSSYLDALEELAKVLETCLEPLSMSSDLPSSSKFVCDVCKHHYTEPRILPCLHTFCTVCLERIEPFTIENKNKLHDSLENFQLSSSKNSLITLASGCETEKSCLTFPLSEKCQTISKCVEEKSEVTVLCPSCNSQVNIPYEGVKKLPLNYFLMHQIKLEDISKDVSMMCCDLCSANIPSVAFCGDCQINLCSFCSEAHRRQRMTSHHQVLLIEEAKCKGILKISRKIHCPSHVNEEVKHFCHTCSVIICNKCQLNHHKGHQWDDISHTGGKQVAVIKLLLSQMKSQVVFVRQGLNSVHCMSKKLTDQVAKVTDEVNKFIDDYVIAVETHRQHLLRQVQRIHVGRQRVLRLQRVQLEQLLGDLQDWGDFVTELLDNGTETELLGVCTLIQQRWEHLSKLKTPLDPKVDDTLNFNPRQGGGVMNGYVLQGMVSSHSVCPSRCFIKGIDLHKATQGEKIQLLLLTRDYNGQPVIKDQSNVQAKLLPKDNEYKDVPVSIADRVDGSYVLTFIPNYSGIFYLHVTISGKHIKGSPFEIIIKPQSYKHAGIFHCCSFCSSEGQKEASCACGGKMPGGYNGCGHGHPGHPGQRHWSCCGKITEQSECVRPRKAVYQYTI